MKEKLSDNIRTIVIPLLVFSFVINLLVFTSPLYMMQIYDRVLSSRSEVTLVGLSVIVVFLMGLSCAFDVIRSRILVRAGLKFDEDIRMPLFDAVSEFERKYPRRNSVQYFRDIDTVRDFGTGNGMIAFCDAPWAPLFVVVCWLLHPYLGITALVGALILFGLAVYGEYSSRALVKDVAKSSAECIGEASGSLRNAETVRALGMLSTMRARWIASRRRFVDTQTLAADKASTLMSVSKCVRQILQSAVLGIGAWLAIQQEISPGIMIAASILVGRALAPVEQVVGSWKGFLAAREAYRRLEALFDATSADIDLPELPAPQGQLAVENLVISVEGVERPLVDDVSLSLSPGQVLGVIGPSGSGKTTLLKAIVGLTAPSAGRVTIDGYALEQWRSDTLGRQVGYVPQDIDVFPGTVAQNVARMNLMDMEGAIRASMSAGMHETIQRFPDGYNTNIGPGGVSLSGGQKQRLAIARALYGEPCLLVMDEPNSNLDGDGEMGLMKAIMQAKARGAAVVFTSHKPSVLRAADMLLVMAGGTVQQYGPAKEILSRLVEAGRPQPLKAVGGNS